MLIDCDSCTARPRACGDCIVTHLLQVGPVRGSTEDSWPQPWDPADEDPVGDLSAGGPAGPATELTDSEVAAVAVLSAGGLVPPLRLVTPTPSPTASSTSSPGMAARSVGAAAGTAGRTGRRGAGSRTG